MRPADTNADDDAAMAPSANAWRCCLSLRVAVLGGLWLLCIVALVALGVWQVQRRAWKLDLIARVEQRVNAPAAPLPPPSRWAAINRDDDEYRHVSITGRFLNERETFVQALTVAGPGDWVVTPLRLADGAIVLVNRGFVPAERRDPATRRDAANQGEVTITGLLRISEPSGRLLRVNDPGSDRWYSRDVAAIATRRGLSEVAPFFIDADAGSDPGGWPRGGLTVVSFPNNHLVYALTWFTLALLLMAAGVQRLRRLRHARPD